MAAVLKVVRAPILYWDRVRELGFAYWWFRGTIRYGRSTASYNCSVVAAQLGRETESRSDLLGVVRQAEHIRADCDVWSGEWCPIPGADELGGYAKRKITWSDFGYWWFRGHVQTGTHILTDYSDGLVVHVGPGGPHVQAATFDKTIDQWVGVWCHIPEPVEKIK